MQNAETVLHVYQERGRRELPLERVYRQLFNPKLFLVAYANLYGNAGAHDARNNRGNRRWHVHGQNRTHHRTTTR